MRRAVSPRRRRTCRCATGRPRAALTRAFNNPHTAALSRRSGTWSGAGALAALARDAHREHVDVAAAHGAADAELDQERLELVATLFLDGDEKQDLTAPARIALGEEAQAIVAAPASQIGTQNGLAIDEPAAHWADACDFGSGCADAVDVAHERIAQAIQVRLELPSEMQPSRGLNLRGLRSWRTHD